MSTRTYTYTADEDNGSFSGSIFIDGVKTIYQPHKPDSSVWGSLEEVSAWCEEHIELLKASDAAAAERETQKSQDSQRLENIEKLLLELQSKLN